jgi:hypothetical protein
MSEDSQQRPIQVGDEIAFRSDYFGRLWTVYKVDKVTKSGRIKAGHYEMNPDLTIRGRSGWGGPYKGVFVTDELRKQIAAEQKQRVLANKISDVRWREIHLRKLQQIDAILQESDE